MELLTVNEVSKIIKVSPQSIYRYITEGKIKVIKFEGNTRIRKEELDRFINNG